MFVPLATKFFLTAGKGEATTELNAFDAALLDAKVGNTNLVKLSSILPPRCEEIQPYELPKGSLVPLAYSDFTSSAPGTVISAAVAVGIPEDASEAGLKFLVDGLHLQTSRTLVVPVLHHHRLL